MLLPFLSLVPRGLVGLLIALACTVTGDHGAVLARDGDHTQAAGAAAASSHERNSTITIAVGGDASLGRDVNLVAARDGASAPLAAVDELRRADLAIANLESVATYGGTRNPDVNGMVPHYFRSRPETLEVLTASGLDLVTTANTHSGDYGIEALREQLVHLAAMGIAAPGSGTDRDAACAPAFLQAKGIVVAIFSFDTTQPSIAATEDRAGTCHLSLRPDDVRETYGQALVAADEQADVVLVMAHWGEDFEAEPSAAKQEVGRLLIDLGADAVLGSHAHQTQGIQVYDERPIIHDAGNLLLHFDASAALFEMTVSRDGVEEIRYIPLVAEVGYTRRPTAAEAEELSTAFAARSAALGTAVQNGRLTLRPPTKEPRIRDPALVDREPREPPEPASEAPAQCVADNIPADAAISRIEVGPLTLLGVRASMDRLLLPGFLRVEGYWRVTEPVNRDLLINGEGRPSDGRPAWYEEQEPCDWLWPTSRWETGQIYQDTILLRPPQDLLSAGGVVATTMGLGSPTSVVLGVTDGEHILGQTDVLAEVSYGAPLPVVALTTTGIVALATVVFRRRSSRSAPIDLGR